MSYPVAEKIFERCLGSPLKPNQEVEVRELLKAMSDAGWPVEEPTSAALISIVGFFYARAPNPIDTALATEQISQALQETTKKILQETVKPIIHLDFLDTFKKTFLEAMTTAISRTALILTGVLLAVAVYGTHQVDAYYMQAACKQLQGK